MSGSSLETTRSNLFEKESDDRNLGIDSLSNQVFASVMLDAQRRREDGRENERERGRGGKATGTRYFVELRDHVRVPTKTTSTLLFIIHLKGRILGING